MHDHERAHVVDPEVFIAGITQAFECLERILLRFCLGQGTGAGLVVVMDDNAMSRFHHLLHIALSLFHD